MTILKLKSIVYRYTGIYLAQKEENDYLTSKEFWKEFDRMKKNTKDKSFRHSYNIQGLLIGLWQCNHKFHRPMSRLHYFGRKPRWFWKTLYSLDSSRISIKWDLERLYKWASSKLS